MQVLQPPDWPAALRLRAEHPDAVPIAGGTDVMAAMELDRFRPAGLLDLSRITDRAVTRQPDGWLRLGALLTYTQLADGELNIYPALAELAAAVGSRQIRNRGTLGGALGSANVTGDVHPLLLAMGARIELDSMRCRRSVPAAEFYLAAGRTVLEGDELIAAVLLPPPAGPQRFGKVGRRQAMVRATCSIAICLDLANRTARIGIGGYGDRPSRAPVAEQFLAAGWDGDVVGSAMLREFGELVAGTTAAREDLRSTAEYRRHALTVLAQRCLRSVWTDRAGQYEQEER